MRCLKEFKSNSRVLKHFLGTRVKINGKNVLSNENLRCWNKCVVQKKSQEMTSCFLRGKVKLFQIPKE